MCNVVVGEVIAFCYINVACNFGLSDTSLSILVSLFYVWSFDCSQRLSLPLDLCTVVFACCVAS